MSCFFLLAACAGQGDALLRTPVTRATLAAFDFEAPVETRQQALFEGEYQIESPVVERLPEAAGHGCAYVILFADDGGMQAGTIDCVMAK